MSEQRSAAWFAERAGKVTASRIADVLARTRSGWGASRANYAAQLIAERLTGTVGESYQNAAMQWGTETEPFARDAYRFHADVDVLEIGFVSHPTIPMAGASPDGLVGDDGLVEIKCPSTASHIETLLGAGFPEKYHLQAQWQMLCTGRKWCDLVSFDPRMPEEMRIYIERVPLDEKNAATLQEQVSVFLAEIAVKVNELREKFILKVSA